MKVDFTNVKKKKKALRAMNSQSLGDPSEAR